MASSASIRAGQAYVELATRDNTARGLAGVTKRLQSWGASITALGSKIFAAGLVIDGAFDATVLQFASAGTEMARLSARTGIGVESLSTLAFAADQSGLSVEQLEMALRRMEISVGEAAGGSAQAQLHFAKLGLSVQALAKMSPEDRFKAIADAISRMSDVAQKMAAAKSIFGRGGPEFLGLLNKGKVGIEELQKTARDWGLEMSTNDAKAALNLTNNLKLLAATVKMLVFQIGKAAAPAFELMRLRIAPVVKSTIEWIKANPGLVVSITKIGLVIMGLGAALIFVGFAFSALGAIISTASTVVGLFLSPWLLIPALVLGAAVAVAYFAGVFDQAGADVKSAWGGIVDAIKAGDLVLAGKIVFAGIKLAWFETVDAMRVKWEEFKQGVVSAATFGLSGKGSIAERFIKGMIGGLPSGMMLNRGLGSAAENKSDIAAARAELERLKKEAAEAASRKRNEPGSKPMPPANLPFVSKFETAGTFSAAAAGRMGFGATLGEKMLDALNDIRDSSADTADAVKGMGVLG